jgi:cytochrome c553
MKKMLLSVALIFAFSISANVALGGESSSALGEKLFNDSTLGGSTNPKSCASCHPKGEGMAKAADRSDLTEMINRCIVGPLKGEKIDGRSVEMRSLKMYIQSLKK